MEKENKNTENKIIGTHYPGVINIPIQVTNAIRYQFSYCEDLGESWPFHYDPKTNVMSLISDRIPDVTPSKALYFTKGYCIEDEREDLYKYPRIVYKISEDTSQGKVYLAIVNFADAKIIIAVKVDRIDIVNKSKWIIPLKETFLKGKYHHRPYIVISSAYMDALCSVLFSHLVEEQISPHFPLCYATYFAGAKYKRNTTQMDSKGTPSQMIWMEYLPHSMASVLYGECDARKWWSAIFQVFAALCIIRNKYKAIHNDFHCKNVRVRKVSKESFLYYALVTQKGVRKFVKVPTYGFVYVLIDFGRCLIFPWKDKRSDSKDIGLISHEFYSGNVRNMIPDNPTIDIVRLITSIEDIARQSIRNKEQLDELKRLFIFCCETNNKTNLLAKINSKSNQDFLDFYLEELPRKICTGLSVFDVMIHFLYRKFRIPESEVPSDIFPFIIPLYE